MTSYKFAVTVLGFQPMSASKGKGKRLAKKKELVNKILSEAGEEVAVAHHHLFEERVRVRVKFLLWDGKEGVTDTVRKKDLDNLLKMVFDALQPYVDGQGRVAGLDLIKTDENIFGAEASKELVKEESQAGLILEVSRFDSVQSREQVTLDRR